MLKRLLIAIVFLLPCIAFPAVILDKDNFVKLTGPIDDESAGKFIREILLQQHKPFITVYIDSQGGSVIAGAQVVQTVRNLKALKPKLHIRCYANMAASMAFVILQSICDERLVGEVSALMQHQATFTVGGRAGEVAARVALITSYLNWMDAIQSVRLNITIKELRARTVDEWWTMGSDAIRANTADRVTPILCTSALTKSTHEEVFQNIFVRATLTWSDCPLVSSPLSVQTERSEDIPLILQMLEDRRHLRHE